MEVGHGKLLRNLGGAPCWGNGVATSGAVGHWVLPRSGNGGYWGQTDIGYRFDREGRGGPTCSAPNRGGLRGLEGRDRRRGGCREISKTCQDCLFPTLIATGRRYRT